MKKEETKKDLEHKILSFTKTLREKFPSPFLLEEYERHFGIKKQVTGKIGNVQTKQESKD